MSTVLALFVLSILGLSEATSWPDGKYCLPRPQSSSCPRDWEEGTRRHDMEDNGGSSNCYKKSHGVIPYNFDLCRDLGWKFCCKTRENHPHTGKLWPGGSYCIFRKGGHCPYYFRSGYLRWDDEDSSNKNNHYGTLPDGVYDHNTKIYFCCRNDPRIVNGKYKTDLEGLPQIRELFVMRFGGRCPDAGAAYTGPSTGFLQWDTEDSGNNDQSSGVVPDGVKTFGTGIKIEFCRYRSLYFYGK